MFQGRIVRAVHAVLRASRPALCCGLLGALALGACTGGADRGPVTSVPTPPHPSLAAVATPLAAGPESMYDLVNEGNLVDADALVRHVWNLPRYKPVALRGMPTWQEDPFKDKYWRFTFYSLRPTTNLLWAYYTTGKSRYRDALIDIVRDYARHEATNPPVDNSGADDPHATAFRAMILVNTYVKLRRSGDLSADLGSALLATISKDARFLALPGNYEATHNHGFSEAAALLLVGVNMPGLAGAAGWAALARERLGHFVVQAVDADGEEVEKSPFYHFYVLDFALQAERWSARNRIPLPTKFAGRVRAMLRFSTEVIWPDGTIPLAGSSVQTRPEGSIGLYQPVLRGFPEFAWAVTGGRTGRPPSHRAVLFPLSGHAILRSPVDPKRPYRENSQLLMDTGRPWTKHAHLEALAVTYYSAGRTLLPDSGLYTYQENSDAFRYFHGGRAHNTVVVDGSGAQRGPVRPGRSVTGPGWAYQSGYASVYPGVVHRRAVLLLAHDLMVVVDLLEPSGPAVKPRTFQQLWHLFPGAHVVLGPAGSAPPQVAVYDADDQPAMRIVQAALTGGTGPGVATAEIGTTGADAAALVPGARAPAAVNATVADRFGQVSPMQGWYSAEYGVLERTHVAEYTARGTGAVFVTAIVSGSRAAASSPVALTARRIGTGVDLDVCSRDGKRSAGAHVRLVAPAVRGEQVFVTERDKACRDGG
jgi:hypothetical protein